MPIKQQCSPQDIKLLKCSRLGQLLVRTTKMRKKRKKKEVEQEHFRVAPEVLTLLKHTLGPCHSEGNSNQYFSSIFPGVSKISMGIPTKILIQIGECIRCKVINTECGNPLCVERNVLSRLRALMVWLWENVHQGQGWHEGSAKSVSVAVESFSCLH